MTDKNLSPANEIPWDDPSTAPFWEAANRKVLVTQHCRACGNHQLYPCPFCLACESDDLDFPEASGDATVYSKVVVHLPTHKDIEPPFSIVLAELREGPRLTCNVIGADVEIGDAVQIVWLDRDDAPPVPAVTSLPHSEKGQA